VCGAKRTLRWTRSRSPLALREVHLSAEPAYGHTFQYHASRWLSGGHRMEATLDAVGDVKSVTLAEPYFRA
jgi:hypothetical protein